MTLVDLRRLAIQKQLTIRFQAADGLECVVSGDGVARVPALRSVPDFNLETALAAAQAFVVEPPPVPRSKSKPVSMDRQALAALIQNAPTVTPA